MTTNFPLGKELYGGQEHAVIPYDKITLSELQLLKDPKCDADRQAVFFPIEGNEEIITTIIFGTIEKYWKEQGFIE